MMGFEAAEDYSLFFTAALNPWYGFKAAVTLKGVFFLTRNRAYVKIFDTLSSNPNGSGAFRAD